jgi:hypothetical protein
MQNGNPSPPSSVARSSDGTGLYSSGMNSEARRERIARLEESLQEHYNVLKSYLSQGLRGDMGPRPNKARDKLLRLSMGQFEELSTDVYDELRRREDMRLGRVKNVPRFLLPIKDFHPKRNQARQKLSTLPPDRFRQLATDVFFELERRFPRFTGRPGSPAMSVASSRSGRPPPDRSMGPPRTSSRGMPGQYRPSPPGSRGPDVSSPEDDYGKPLPKTFQQNTIVPNKSTMVEDESGDEDVPDDLYDMTRMSKRSAKSGNSSEVSFGSLFHVLVILLTLHASTNPKLRHWNRKWTSWKRSCETKTQKWTTFGRRTLKKKALQVPNERPGKICVVTWNGSLQMHRI